MNLEDEKDWSHVSGIVSATNRAVGMVKNRATAAFLAGRDEEARVLRALAVEIEDGTEHANTKLDLYIERAKQEGVERAARRARRRAR